MTKNVSRRSFIENLTLSTSGIALLSSTSLIHAVTKDEVKYEGYNPYAPRTQDLRQTVFSKYLKVSGKIVSKETLEPLANAQVEVWHLSPNTKKYRHRAKLTTDEQGNYTFLTDLPDMKRSCSMSINFKLSANHRTDYSQLWISGPVAFITSEHWEKNQHMGELLMPETKSHLSHTNITFNLSV